MSANWGSLWQRSRRWLKTGWLITSGLIAVYIGAIQPSQDYREIAAQRASGLAAVRQRRDEHWPRRLILANLQSPMAEGVAGGVPGGVSGASAIVNGPPPPSIIPVRKLTRTGSIGLVVKSPADTAEKIAKLAEGMGGFLLSETVSGQQDAASAEVAISVPAGRIDEARKEIRNLGLRVETDRIEARDVTEDYVDRDARLRNLRAQERQYLGILRRATTVKDTLEVSEKLNSVRGQIDQEQAEFEALSKQVETVAITVSLASEAEAQVFGLRWRPLYQLKLAAREGVEGIAEYVTTMVMFFFYLPTILLWLMSILVCAAAGWRILRWGARIFFAPRPRTIDGS